ncbi:MAG: hypothetical protein NTU85_00200 [Candidatus Kaiserbacteria bacterium]|nr:hypothetical protein [Candidatus Kaiserbacteria bacterium]
MKTLLVVLFVAVLLVLAVSEPAMARGGVRFGVYVGMPMYYAPYHPIYYPQPAYYPVPVYNYPPPMPQGPQVPPPQSRPARFFCPSSNMYYPDTQACPGGWEGH